MREEFIKEATDHIKRKGLQDLLYYLENETDFFNAPASSKYHGAFEGGLIEHSLAVFDIAKELINKEFELGLPLESLAIAALFHDVCKANYYSIDKKNQKINGTWTEVEFYNVKDELPMGHGEKSVFIIQKFMQLSDEEALAIRWHLGGYDPGYHFFYPTGSACQKAMNENKLVSTIASADFIASYILEK